MGSLLKEVNIAQLTKCSYSEPSIFISKAELDYIFSATRTLTVQGVVGIRKGCEVEASSVLGDVSGLVVSSVVTARDVAVGGAIVPTVKVCVGGVLSAVTVVSMEVGWDVVMLLGVVSRVDVVEAVGLAVLGVGCGVGEDRGGGGGVDVGGDDADTVGTVGVVGEEGKVVGEGGEEVRDTVVASEDAVEGGAAVGVDGFSGVSVSGGVSRGTVVGGTVEDRDLSKVVARSGAVGVGVEATVVVEEVVVGDLSVVEEVVAPLLVAVAAVVAVAVVEASDGVLAIVVVAVGAGVVLLDRVTYGKGVGVGGRKTPGGDG